MEWTLTATNPTGSLGWMIFFMQKYANMFIQGTLITLYVAILGTLAGFLLGYIMGIIQDLKVSKEDFVLKKLAAYIGKSISLVYVEIFRGTPMIVQGMIIYYGLLQADVKISSVVAGILVTLLNTGAYMAETVRAGIKSVDPGHREGALALGMTLFDFQKLIIEDLAATESCVIVGKCADWILRGQDGVISIYIEAAREFCVRRRSCMC